MLFMRYVFVCIAMALDIKAPKKYSLAMEVQKITCENCFAPLQIPIGVTQIVCQYCKTPLHVAGNVQANPLEQMGRDLLQQQVNFLKKEAEIRKFEELWKSKLQEFMTYNKNKNIWKEPKTLLSWIGLFFFLPPAVSMIGGAFVGSTQGAPVLLFVMGVLLLLLSVFVCGKKIIKAKKYRSLRYQYNQERQNLLSSS